jgi:hypothetical protein
MSKIKMKIVDYDVNSNSIIVAFASENAKKPIESYPQCAYQPTMFNDPGNPEKIFEEIARAGIHVSQQQDKEDNFKAEQVLENKYKQYIGKILEFDTDTLIENADQSIEIKKTSANIVDEILDEILIDEPSNDPQEKSNQ